eukprot:5150776-Amphidinium_carterae.1
MALCETLLALESDLTYVQSEYVGTLMCVKDACEQCCTLHRELGAYRSLSQVSTPNRSGFT